MTDVMMPEGMVHAERAEVHEKQPAVYAAGRICDEPLCGTRLSIYNRSTTCALHAHVSYASSGHRVHRGRRRAASAA
ncbi:MAG: hypothetical protein WAL04_16200 [Acidimicrobiales bacterium]|jgi:hypothetical protein